MKAGFAGGSKPKVTVGTKVGRTKHMRIMPGGALEQQQQQQSQQQRILEPSINESGYYCGRKLDEHRGAFLVEYPMEHGIVQPDRWDAMELLWEHVYSKDNLNAKMEDHPVLLTEAPLNPRYNRERTAEVFFETMRTPALFFAPQAVLSLYASGRTTGVVMDVGEGVSHAMPVYEGFALPHSIARSDVAGRDVTRHLQLLLRRSGLSFSTTAEADLVKDIKEHACYVAFNPHKEEEGEGGGESAANYQLPDGQVVTLGTERFRAPEVLFRPELIGSEEAGVADMLVNSVMKSDLDLRATLFDQVVLSGGSTLFSGFGDRFLHEVRQRAPGHTRIRISAPPERIHSTWVGGSILASLSTFKNMWVSLEDYEEYGSSLLHRKAL
eukprot:CAMPEP_0195520650 /NCGR_PEP_ID=MMETSP0794_2-20130614/17378_1 /TAXON_ID=515487 /ORGANISM="Stephanopyxis turris, Strain CCMP 815" /LENGTH=381 /DNA_ID=CAMNT_0040650061 /DNA_START=153 /DNA_END=1298 /DNA_ORIENTATION=+